MRESIDLITEYLKIDSFSEKPREKVQEMLSETTVLTGCSSDGIGITIHAHKNGSLFILTEHRKNLVIGYVEIYPFDRSAMNIRQVRGVTIYDAAFRGKRIIGTTYLTIAQAKGWTLIHDETLADGGEGLWKGLIRQGYVRSIYDKRGNVFYNLEQVGSQTPDGSEILNPQDDQAPPGTQQFFWAISSNHNPTATAAHSEGARRHHFGQDLMMEHYNSGGHHLVSPFKTAEDWMKRNRLHPTR